MPSEPFDLFCPECNILVEAQVVASGYGGFESKGATIFDEVDAEYYGDVLYIALCRRCKSPFLVRQSLHGVPGEFETITSEEVLYPASLKLPLERVLGTIRSAYDQAARCYATSPFDACALMYRRPIEGLCRKLGADPPGSFGPMILGKMALLRRGADEKEPIYRRADGRDPARGGQDFGGRGHPDVCVCAEQPLRCLLGAPEERWFSLSRRTSTGTYGR